MLGQTSIRLAYHDENLSWALRASSSPSYYWLRAWFCCTCAWQHYWIVQFNQTPYFLKVLKAGKISCFRPLSPRGDSVSVFQQPSALVMKQITDTESQTFRRSTFVSLSSGSSDALLLFLITGFGCQCVARGTGTVSVPLNNNFRPCQSVSLYRRHAFYTYFVGSHFADVLS